MMNIGMKKWLIAGAVCLLAGCGITATKPVFEGQWEEVRHEVSAEPPELRCAPQRLNIQPHEAVFVVSLDGIPISVAGVRACTSVKLECSNTGERLQCELSNPEMGPRGFAPVLSINSTTGRLVLENAQGEWGREFVRINNE